MGGWCWRRWEPTQASHEFGREYESWEWNGLESEYAASILRGKRARPSRVDVAFDLWCEESGTSDEFIERVKSHVEQRQLSIGISGKDGNNTRYIGSAKSERRIRVYRKDRQEGEVWVQGATLRVELVLRGEMARRWWEFWERSEDEAFAVAAWHIAEMTGFQVQPELMCCPGGRTSEEKEAVGLVHQFVKQHRGTLWALRRAGLDLNALTDAGMARASRETHWRARKRADMLWRAGVEDVQEAVVVLLTGGMNVVS